MANNTSVTKEISTVFKAILVLITAFQLLFILFVVQKWNSQKQIYENQIVLQVSAFVSSITSYLEQCKNGVIQSGRVLEFLRGGSQMAAAEPNSHAYGLLAGISVYNTEVVCFDTRSHQTDITGGVTNLERAKAIEMFNLYAMGTQDAGLRMPHIGFFGFHENNLGREYFYLIEPIIAYDFDRLENVLYGHVLIFTKIDVAQYSYNTNFSNDIRVRLACGGDTITLINKGSVDSRLFLTEFTDIPLPDTAWNVSGIFRVLTPMYDAFMLLAMFTAQTLCVFVLVFAFKRRLRKDLITPLNKLSGFIQAFNLTDEITAISIEGNSEIKLMAERVHDMFIRNKHLARQIFTNQQTLYESELQAREMTLRMLEYQVNPHVIYNTLELMSSIASFHGVGEIQTVAGQFAAIMRYNLNNKHFVSIEEELNICKKYIDIMAIKYGDGFNIYYDFAGDILPVRIIKAIFQPIVENMFKHGYRSGGEPFEVRISGHISDDFVILEFCDNGYGIAAKRLEQIRRRLTLGQSTADGIGLFNIHQRLVLHYGNDCGIGIESEENKYTKVRVTLR